MLINFIEPNFKFSDDRGVLVQLVRDGWKQVNYILSEKNVVRGGHYHRFNKEAFYVVNGKFKLLVEHISTHERKEYIINAGDFFVIPPNVQHSFEYMEQTVLISMYDLGV